LSGAATGTELAGSGSWLVEIEHPASSTSAARHDARKRQASGRRRHVTASFLTRTIKARLQHTGLAGAVRAELWPVAAPQSAGPANPCHGSKLAGRVYNGSPAPTNLVVPRYSFLSEAKIVVGRDEEGEAK